MKDFRTEPAENGLSKVFIGGIEQSGRYTIMQAAELCDKLRAEENNNDD